MKVIDLTHTIKADMPVYPGTEPPTLLQANTIEKDLFKETKLSMYSHTGTHIDPPAHIIKGALTLDKFPASQFVGRALVIDCSDAADGSLIGMEYLERYKDKIDSAEFLLFYFGYDKKWGTEGYFGNFPCIDHDVLEHIINGNYKGIGFDVISLDPIDCLDRHTELFSKKNIINIENLNNLGQCGSDLFTLACLPLKWEDADGAPARAIAMIE